ncbi:MAG: hypothetical protein ACTSQQ_07750, partial [Candidatus Helarchaeota archaeon]
MIKQPQKWVIKFAFKKQHNIQLVDLKGTGLFNYKYPVFKMLLARELMEQKGSNFCHIKRDVHETTIRDPQGA